MFTSPSTEPRMNGFMLPGSLGLEGDGLVATHHTHPVDILEPLEEELSRPIQIQQQVLLHFLGLRDGSLASIAAEFGVTRSLVSRYSRQIASKIGLPPIRNKATAERCREAQLARRRKKDPARSLRAGNETTKTSKEGRQ
jgi:AraC-like DNA-binding protein